MTSSRILNSFLVLGLAGTAATAVGGPEVPASVGSGTFAGKLTYDGVELPKPEILDMTSKPEHAEHCMKAPDKNSQALVVDAATKGIANAYVELRAATDDVTWQVEGTVGPQDQSFCRFEPHVLVVPVGKEVVFKNSDPFMHNVHFYCRKNDPLNFGVPENGEKGVTFKKDEVIRVKCDVHTWMDSYVITTSNPYHAVTGVDGTCKIENVPPGKYELRVWHETLGQFKIKDFEIKEGDNAHELKHNDSAWKK